MDKVDLVALLCAEEAGFVTGQIIHVDDGASLASTDLPLELQTAGEVSVHHGGPADRAAASSPASGA